MTWVPLHDGWSLRLSGDQVPADLQGDIPAMVPGVVHADLLAASLIPDPYLGTAEQEVSWIGECDATYRCTFDRGGLDADRIDLVAEGLDTVATVTLNGTVVGRTRNQHRSYRLDVTGLLTPHGNELVVAFDAPLRAARESEARIRAKPLVDDALLYNALRKMACNFGWDWGPTLTTAGIWAPIGLESWFTARIASAVPRVDVSGRVELHVELERTGGSSVDLALDVLDSTGAVVARERVSPSKAWATLVAEVDAPQLWWPREYGAQPLYRLELRVCQGERELDT